VYTPFLRYADEIGRVSTPFLYNNNIIIADRS
jgi:hypothetical protein